MIKKNIIFLFGLVCLGVNAASFNDGDFDLDSIKDKITISHDKNIQFKFTPSSSGKEIKYNLEYLNSADEGFTDLYKYHNKNYMVSYYSDFRGGDQYTEGLYRWDSKLNNFVLYMGVDVIKKNGILKYKPKMAICCTLLGDENTKPQYLSNADEVISAEGMVKNIDNSLKIKDGFIGNITAEEISFISYHYRPEFKDVLLSLKQELLIDENSDSYNILASFLNKIAKESLNNDNENYFAVVTSDKAELYDDNGGKLKSYLVKGDSVNVTSYDSEGGMVGVIYTMRNGKDIKALMTRSQLDITHH